MRFSAWFAQAAVARMFVCARSGPPIPETATGTPLFKNDHFAYAENLDLAVRGHILGSAAITGLYKT